MVTSQRFNTTDSIKKKEQRISFTAVRAET